MSNDTFSFEKLPFFGYLVYIHCVGLLLHLTLIALKPKRIVKVCTSETDPITLAHAAVFVHA